jgi:hypothetical protein
MPGVGALIRRLVWEAWGVKGASLLLGRYGPNTLVNK